jgi:predicted transcriptional regulator
MPENTAVGTEVESDEQDIGFVAGSSNRTTVLTHLIDGPAGASAIARTEGLSASTAKTAAENLREQGLVELLATDETRAYVLTTEGEKVLFVLEQTGEI